MFFFQSFKSEDTRGFDICRPMREILEDEIHHFLTLKELKVFIEDRKVS